jgi:peptidoglycan/xylan/chitin deacetylase (PgdA/CDA1 family)
MRRKFFAYISIMTLLLIACGGLNLLVSPAPTPTPSLLPSATASLYPTVTPTPSAVFPTHTATLPPTETASPTLTFTPTLTPEPQWVVQGPGQVIVPILLYHHIGFSQAEDSAYYVSPEAFDQQMNILYQWGYRTVSVELLARAIQEGAEMPPKPILLTFDDGSATTYSTALPIMQRYGFTGVSYIVYYTIGLTHYMNVDQIRALHAAGWEIGSHSLSHKDLTIPPYRQEDEIVQSRRMLATRLGVPILSFAYPFGAYDESSLGYVRFAGYTAAMGLGNDSAQRAENLFYLYRQAVNGTDDLRTFASRLPWREEHVDLPPLTIVP